MGKEFGDEAIAEGPAPMPEMAQIKPASKIARRMEKLIHDEIDESNGSQELRSAVFEAVLLGTGVVKGPFTFNKTLHKWQKSGVALMEIVSEPDIRSADEAGLYINKIRSILDLACGDFNWMSQVLKNVDVDYIGSDIVEDLIISNRKKSKRI